MVQLAWSLFIPILVLSAPTWPGQLQSEIRALDAATEGNIGLYLKRVGQAPEFDYAAKQSWYLASTIKVPVAIALLQKVEAGSFSLDQELTVRESDFVDGAGDVNKKKPGEKVSVRYLLEKMLTRSDSAATDMIIRLIGVDALNRQIREKMVSTGFGPVTTILQVRYDAYSELHPSAKRLSNLDFFDLKKADQPERRLELFLSKLGLRKAQLLAPSVDEAFERYYRKGLNSATLEAFGALLERLAKGQLLSPANTALVLVHMRKISTGEKRLKAGLPKDILFAQKTGTQIRRMCNVGLATRERPAERQRPSALASAASPASEASIVSTASLASTALVVAACIEKYSDQERAEQALSALAQKLDKTGVL